MAQSTWKRIAFGAMLTVTSAGFAGAAHANDFFSALFGAMTGQGQPSAARGYLPYAGDGSNGAPAPVAQSPSQAPVHTANSGGRQAYCVRTCDGRYFPINVSNGQSRAESCNSFCPASETKVFYGSSIDHAASDHGKTYSSLPNAFRYRNEIVAGCTCNGKDQFGLAKIDVKDDPTLRKGDIVASKDGLVVAGSRPDRRSASLNFSPASPAIKAKFAQYPVVASE